MCCPFALVVNERRRKLPSGKIDFNGHSGTFKGSDEN